MDGESRCHPCIAAGRRITAEMAKEIDNIKRKRTEEALKHAAYIQNIVIDRRRQ